jgi:hypothetical protein
MACGPRPDRPARRALLQAAAITGILVVVLLLRVPVLGLALRLWLVTLGAIAVGALVRAGLAGHRVGDGVRVPRPRWGWWRRQRPPRIRPLEELEHAVDFALGTAFDVHYRLRPQLRGIAAHRLAMDGISLDGQPAMAREALGDETWELVRPNRPEPDDRNARGLDLAHLRRVVERLDAL